MKKRGLITGIAIGAALLVLLLVQQGGLGVSSVSGLFDITDSGDGTTVQRIRHQEVADDLAALSTTEQNFGSISVYFADLAQEKGGVHAYEVLRRAEFPPNIDLHLLGHVVGDELYKQTGFEGMKYCTHDFRNACSHSIVIGALLEDGPLVFDEVNEVCKQAPGGPGAYTMCFHGFGHGVLAYTEYEMPDAVELCKRVGTPQYNDREYHECVGGAVMEMDAGVHDPEMWERKVDKYVPEGNPVELCQADYMPTDAQPICFTYITPYLFEAAGADLGSPTPDDFQKSFRYCEAADAGVNRDTCYSGFGKEFIVLVQGRDIRNMERTTNEQLETVIGWCELTDNTRGQDLCKLEVLNSLYWGGENHYDVSIRYCSLLTPQSFKNECFDRLISFTSHYHPAQSGADLEYREGLCADVPSEYTKQCEDTLL